MTKTPEQMEHLLQLFAYDYRHWVENGAHEHSMFARNRGLCYLVDDWFEGCYPGEGVLQGWSLCFFMQDECFKGYENHLYPFGGDDLYLLEHLNNKMHLNPLRMEWINYKADGGLGSPPVTWQSRIKLAFHKIKVWFQIRIS